VGRKIWTHTSFMNMRQLTIKQNNFCNYYLETGNASEAYRRAYSCESMKDETVTERASRLLKEYKISTRVNQLQAALQERSDISKDEAVKELTNIVRCRVTDVLNAKGKTVTIKKLEEKNLILRKENPKNKRLKPIKKSKH